MKKCDLLYLHSEAYVGRFRSDRKAQHKKLYKLLQIKINQAK